MRRLPLILLSCSLLLPTLARPAAAQTPLVRLTASWGPDRTGAGSPVCDPPGSTVGGPVWIDVDFEPPPGTVSYPEPTCQAGVEDTQQHVIPIITPYDPAGPSCSGEWRFRWESWTCHNNAHSAAAVVTYTVMVGYGPSGPIFEQRQADRTEQFTAANLVVTNTTSAPHERYLLWNPAGMSTAPLSCTYTSANTWNVNVVYTIRDPVTHAVVREETRAKVSPGSDTWDWDGTDGSSQPLPAGVYVYEIKVEVPYPTFGMHADREKSDFLTVGEVTTELLTYDDETFEATVCTLKILD